MKTSTPLLVISAWLLSAAVSQDLLAAPSPAPTATSTPAAQVRLQGLLLEKGTRKPIPGANVFCIPEDGNARLRATTDSEGRFTIDGAPEGAFQWIVNLPGFLRFDRVDSQAATGTNALRTLYVEKTKYQIYETTVVGQEERRDDTVRSLKASEIVNLPGSSNDPIKALQNLPGINRPAPFQSQVIIQGSAPQDTRYQIDGHEVPIIFHFGGLSSVVPPEALDRVDYLSAGYGPENGRAMGGIVSVQTRDPRTDRTHGFAFIDVFNAGVLMEGKAGAQGGWMLGARQSYIGQVLKLVLKKDSNFDLTVAPSFSDLTGLYETELSPRDHFRLLAVGSLDRLEFLFERPQNIDPAIRGTFSNETAFFRLIPELTHRHSENTFSRWSLGFGRDWVNVNVSDNYFHLRNLQLTSRGEVEHRFSELWTASWGVDNRNSEARVDLLLPTVYFNGGIANPFSSGALRQVGVDAGFSDLGVYWKNQIRPSSESPWTWLPSLRAERYSETGESFVLPRLGARYQVDESLLLRASGGLYVQPPQPQETNATVGNPDIHSPKAWHLAAAAEKDLRGGSSQGFRTTLGGFYRFFDQLVIPTPLLRPGTNQPLNFTNDGRGRAFGLEALVRFDINPWTGWLSYTLSRSRRWGGGRIDSPFQYDQTHLLTAIGERDFANNWRVGARLRFATGNPNTPVTGGVFDADNDVYFPERGPFYSSRLNPFLQLDLRVDKRWIYERWILSFYVDIQNLLNRQNIEQVQYAYDYSTSTKVSGLPILPTLGLRAEF